MITRYTESAPALARTDAAGIAHLTLNRPTARNALSVELLTALQSALADIAADPAIKVVVLSGAGPGFCGGHDLKEMRADPRRETQAALFRQCSEMMLQIVRLPKIVIARVHGIAAAAGCQLVATCDLAVAGESARFAVNGINVGLFCSTPMVALTRAIGRKAAMEMLVTGDMVDAPTAKAIGLVNRVVPDDQLDAEVERLARQIASKSPRALVIGKEAFYRQAELSLSAAYDYTAEVMATNMMAADAAEGIDAFIAKRPPVWRGE